jgi:hypothetical protein
MSSHILEWSTLKVRAKVSTAGAKPADFQFHFFKDGKEFDQMPGQEPKGREGSESSDKQELTAQGWVEASLPLPLVDDDKEKYVLTYTVTHGKETKTDLPSFTVWPKQGTLKVKDVKDPAKGLKGFQFKLMQGGKQQGEVKTVTKDDGTYKFDLQAGNGFSIDPVVPCKIAEAGWEKETGRNRVCKADFDFEADFLAPLKGAVKQYVNLASDPTAATAGQNGAGSVLRLKVGVKGDSDKPAEAKLFKPGMIVHVRVTFGPPAGGGGIEKSLRVDPAAKTEIKNELDLSGMAAAGTPNAFKAKVTLKPDGTGELKAYLGLAGGDVCKVEIAGSDRFLKDTAVAADAVLTITNWRKLYYELMAPDFYAARELVSRADPVTKTNHLDFPTAALDKLKEIGDSCFIEYVFEAVHTFTAANAPIGAAAMSKRFLGMDNSADLAYVLTDYTMNVLPTGAAWAATKPGLSNYIKLCDQNYYWEATDSDGNVNARKSYASPAVTTKKHRIPMAAFNGYFIPISGLGSGAGEFSVKVADPGAPGFKWKALVDMNFCKTRVEAIVPARTPGQDGKHRRVIKVKEANQNQETEIEFLQPKIGNITKDVTAPQKIALEKWLADRFAPAALKQHGNKISITIESESGNSRRDDRHNAVKAIIEARLNQLKASHSISVHPGLTDAGVARSGTFTQACVNMGESTRKEIVIDLPDAAPADPGTLVGAMSAAKCPVKIECFIEAHNNALGLCENANVLACFSKAAARVDVCTTLHELGHSYGMTVFTNADLPPVGMARPKSITQAEPIARYKTVGNNKGNYYDAHDHSGSHCAYGLTDVEKTNASYQTSGVGASARCIMFGSGGRDRPFCPQCIDLIRGTNLKALPVVAGS